MKKSLILAAALLGSSLPSTAQVNSGSDGHDGAFNPTQSVEIDMADHPDGIYHYTSVNIPSGITVTFKPNAANTPVVWLVQGDCVIGGIVSLVGGAVNGAAGKSGGPGGFPGGNASLGTADASSGLGPGGGRVLSGQPNLVGGNGSFATVGEWSQGSQHPSGETYGSSFLVPLIGGSGGSGGKYSSWKNGGGGGGGAILIASSQSIAIAGSINANGGGVSNGESVNELGAGAGSGGAIRLVTATLTGNGGLSASGGNAGTYSNYGSSPRPLAGTGRIRIDAMVDNYLGGIIGSVSRGFQPIIIPPANQAVALAIQLVGGVAVAQSPTGKLISPDVIVPGAQQNPVSIVVACTNIPLGTEIIVDVKPANGPAIRAVGLNNTGIQASSTATVQVTMPRGGGTIQAKAISGIQLAANDDPNAEHHSMAQTGWTADGERFKSVEVTAGLGTASQLAYITESGKRYTLSSR